MYQTVTEEAWELVHTLSIQCSAPQGLGTMSAAAYDTAWVAMIERKDDDGKGVFLFPEAHEFLKATQSKDGTWASATSDVDGIVNTLAALLALKRQSRLDETTKSENEPRCHRAETTLRKLLNDWDIHSSDRVGLEILVPNLLRLLEAEGILFDFPSRKALMDLNAAKLSRLGPILTSPVQTTLIHTLEAFDGTLDFDKVRHHKMPNGSMLASPSSTAAYLMNATEWDNDSEAYLRQVYEEYSKMGQKGGFPSAFPSTIFEISWVLEVLLEGGFTQEDFLLEDIRKLTFTLQSNLKNQQGIVGFAPFSLPDADDTAKTITILGLMGWKQSIEPMLKAFEAEASFRTYRGERNASTTANCNILLCLLRSAESSKYTSQIVKCVQFLVQAWMANSGPDKWHTSVVYPMMLVAQSLTVFLNQWGKNELQMDAIPAYMVQRDVPKTLLNILARTMSLQQSDGSWESKREVTAYGVLTLASLLKLPWIDFMKPEGIAAMYRGKAYLEKNRHFWKQAEVLWIEKTAYSSSNLAQAYCLAACKVAIPTAVAPQIISNLVPQLDNKALKMQQFFSRIVPFSESAPWKLQLSLVQSGLYKAALKEARFNIFPPMRSANDEKYLEYIPFTWLGCRDVLSTAISSEMLWEMMLISMFNFQVDAYMETVVWDHCKDNLSALKDFIRGLCSGVPVERKRKCESGHGGALKKIQGSNGVRKGASNGVSANGLNSHTNGTSNGTSKKEKQTNRDSNDTRFLERTQKDSKNADEESIAEQAQRVGADVKETPDKPLRDIETELTKFVHYTLRHPRVVQSPPALRLWLAHEMQTFLLAHITHMEDCANFSTDRDTSAATLSWEKPRTTYFNWVHTTSADHTSCPYSFVFFLCLIGEPGRGVVKSVYQRYVLEDTCRHLATMCRQYNDLGSVVRDYEEKNLNSVNFPEFKDFARSSDEQASKDIVKQKKRDLLQISEYERQGLNNALHELEKCTEEEVSEKLKLFVQVTDLYGQIYVARDIGIRRVEGPGA
ncbi:Ent-kaurene synthase [Delitschia confertaspora ATCC 74209]|uniref:Ent-kaurene synthase n=1 Tax=Delitschia confertaspora ATCC 74209 TaxID=1513339 RepID=A0A9P4JGQ2_9PLEO|nr:Ent-kaurene synthase [Delitschia confertaspora ATCC 74209]